MKVVTKCRRVCSPSVTMSMPADSWSASARRSPQVPRSEAAADVDLGTVAVADQLEAAPVGRAVGGDPVADLGRAVADGGQALVEEIDELVIVAVLEMADAFAVEGLVDLAHGGLADRVAQAPGREDRHANVFRIGANRFREHGSPLQAAPHARIRRLEVVEDDRNDRGQGIEPASPQRNAEAVVERQMMRHGGLEVALERGLQNVVGEFRMPRDRLEGTLFHPRLCGSLVDFAHADADTG